MITIEIAYAEPEKQIILSLKVKSDTTVAQAIVLSNIQQQFPNMVVDDHHVGIWSKKCKLNQALQHKDRIEIYRPLLANPKEIRRQMAKEQQLK